MKLVLKKTSKTGKVRLKLNNDKSVNYLEMIPNLKLGLP
jgi:hypothetical protein